MSINRHFISLILAGSWCCVAMPDGVKAASTRAFGQLPLIFERNQGQSDSSIRYLARGHQYVVGLVDDGVELRLKGAHDSIVHLQLSGERRNSRFDATEKLPGVSNYLIGNDPEQWIQGVPQYGKIWRRGAYPGIDVAYYGNQGQLEYDFVVNPGAEPDSIRMRISGARKLRIDAGGDLIIDVNGAELRLKLPVAWQEKNGTRQNVVVQYRLLSSNMVGVIASGYDKQRLPLIIDPVLALSYSTYLGGSLADQSNGIAVDPFGNTWIAGATSSVDFPVTGSPKPVNAGGTDAFVAKLDPTGTMLLFSTYLGGAGTDQANGIAVDSLGNAYVTGSTTSTNFPTKAPLQMANAGGMDAFALKLTSTGALVYSTYIGGTSDDSAAGIAVDTNGVAYIAGYTSSGNFPTAFPQQNVNHGGKDAFVLKLSAAGSGLTYSTYLGGASDDLASGIAVDSSGNAYVTGSTQSSDFPLSAALQTKYGGGGDAFVVKLNAGGLVVYSTYLGGSGGDTANAIAVDSFGDAYIAGSTTSFNFPVVNAFQAQQADATSDNGVSPDAFLSKLNAAGTALVFSTYFGGPSIGSFSMQQLRPGGADVASGVAVDTMGNAYMTGSTATPSSTTITSPPSAFPLLDPFQGYTGPKPPPVSFGPAYLSDAFLASFSPTGTLLYSTDLGGTLDDVATAVAVDTFGAAYVTGYSQSANFPLLTPLQATNNGTSNAFISKLTFTTPGVRVFFGAAVPSSPDLNVTAAISAPITISGANCSAGNYTAASVLNGYGTSVIFQTGASCAVSIQPNVGSGGVRWGFSSWGDGSTANPRTFAAPAHGTAYTINEAAQVLLTTSASPVVGGMIVVSPSSPDGYYPSGTVVTLTAVPLAGFVFSSFSGDAIGITNGQTVTMSTPRNVTAMFVPSTPPTIMLDNPVAGSSISGNVAVTGWAIDNTSAVGTAISVVQVKVDGVLVGNATYGTARADVCSVYPGRPGCPNVGFTFTFNANSLVPGTHVITVSAVDSDGTPDASTATVSVTSSLVMPGTKVGVFRAGAAFLEDTNGNGVYDPGVDRFIASFTAPGGAQTGDIAVVGDWTGDGHAKVGIYRPSAGTWWLDANNDGTFDAGDFTYQFGGVAGDVPVVGDWNAVAGVSTHKDCIGLFRSGFLWVLDMNCNGAFDDVPMDAVFPFGGLGGDVPVVGKWTGGTTRVGVVRKYAPGGVPQGNPFYWVLDSGNANAGTAPANHQPAAGSFAFGGLTGDVFVTGDWTGGGTFTAGVFRSGFWVLDAGLPGAPQASHVPGLTFGYGGATSDVPVTGKW